MIASIGRRIGRRGVTLRSKRKADPIAALPGKMMWLDAGALTGFEEDDVVDEVPDLSGNGRNGTQGVFTQMPVYRANGIGGRPALQLDGIDDYIHTSLSLSQPLTIIAVIKLSSTAGANPLYDGGASRVHQYHEAGPGWRLYAGGFGDSGFAATTNREIHVAVFNGASSALRVNGVSSAVLNPGTNALGNLLIGTNTANDVWMNGLLGEFVVINGALSAGQIAAIEAHRANKFSIAL